MSVAAVSCRYNNDNDDLSLPNRLCASIDQQYHTRSRARHCRRVLFLDLDATTIMTDSQMTMLSPMPLSPSVSVASSSTVIDQDAVIVDNEEYGQRWFVDDEGDNNDGDGDNDNDNDDNHDDNDDDDDNDDIIERTMMAISDCTSSAPKWQVLLHEETKRHDSLRRSLERDLEEKRALINQLEALDTRSAELLKHRDTLILRKDNLSRELLKIETELQETKRHIVDNEYDKSTKIQRLRVLPMLANYRLMDNVHLRTNERDGGEVSNNDTVATIIDRAIVAAATNVSSPIAVTEETLIDLNDSMIHDQDENTRRFTIYCGNANGDERCCSIATTTTNGDDDSIMKSLQQMSRAKIRCVVCMSWTHGSNVTLYERCSHYLCVSCHVKRTDKRRCMICRVISKRCYRVRSVGSRYALKLYDI